MSAGFIDIVTNDTDENGVTTERRLHLNNPDGIFHIREWKPLAPPPEDLYQFSPFEDGRVLAMRKYGNVADEWVMDAAGSDSTAVDQELQALRALLKKAVDYWIVDWQMEPVWIEMMGDGESNIRYSYIYAWDIPEEANPFQNPRNECPSLIPEFPLRIEHGFWLSSMAGECVEMSATQDYYDIDEADFVPTEQDDDCFVEHVGSTIDLANVFLAMGDNAGATYSTGVRVRNVTIPPGAIITHARVYFESRNVEANDNCNITIAADDVDTAAIFTTYANFMGRARTTAHVHWNAIEHFAGGGAIYVTPDISPVIQEIVNRGGWASGHDLALLFDNNSSTANAIRTGVSFDQPGPREEPRLEVHWSSTMRTFGQTATCDPVYFADRHNQAQLTHAFAYDASLGTYSANLIGAALPYTLLPAVPAVGDMLYLICETGVPNSGPFGSVVFDLFAVDLVMTGVWEYWNGAWVTIPVLSDFTDQFHNLGINDVNWKQPLDWVTTAVNLVTGYSVRFRVTNVALANIPVQQNRQLYSVVTPFMDIDSTQVGGDVAMLAATKMYERSIYAGAQIFRCNKFIAGLRKLKRGLNFTAYINLADEQNPSGITIQSMIGAFQDDTTSETGRAIYWNSGSTNFELCGRIIWGGTIGHEYQGSYMVYLRTRLTDVSSHYQFKFQFLGSNNVLYESPICTPELTHAPSDRIAITALGELVFPFDPLNLPADFEVQIFAKVDNIAYNAYLHTFIMMPNDEWIGQYDAPYITSMLLYDRYLAVNPISNIKLSDVATVRDISDGYTYHFWDDKSPHFPRLHERDKQRLWLFHPASFENTDREAYCSHIGKFELDAIKKYFGSWG